MSNMVIAQLLIALAASASDATENIIHHCTWKTNYQTIPATEIKKQKKKWWLPVEKRVFATLLWLSTQIEVSVEP